jgi:O-acetyl-ADP-ribose deacetylase (regulator of RNase III)
MITQVSGNLLEAKSEALVNTVNTVGVMGKGIALQFKKAFPEVFRKYAKDCKEGAVQLGRMHVVDVGGVTSGPRWIINFPTKAHWKSKSRLSDIEEGLEDLIRVVRELGIQSIAIPPLGCGYGGLNWSQVLPVIESAFASVPEVEVLLFTPGGAPAAASMPNRTERPNMTAGRAALLLLMDQYLSGLLNPFVTLIEVHKLMYLLQVGGYDVDLQYEKGTYGPYSTNLRHLLSRVEGHFVSGFGEGSDDPTKEMHILNGSVTAAREFVASQDESGLEQGIERVRGLIEGFEDPQGMELLASVHWVLASENDVTSEDDVVRHIHNWSQRKRAILKAQAIRKSVHRFVREGWIEPLSD